MDQGKEKLLVLKAKHDPDAFGELFDIYYPKLLNFAVHRTGNSEAAKDITSQVFIKVLHNIKKFQWREIPFSAWIYRIASNEINDYFRRGKRSYTQSLENLMSKYGFEPEDSSDIVKELIDAEQEIERHQLFLIVHNELLKLNSSYHEVIVLKYFEHKRTTEIAEILNKKEGTVKSLLSRGLTMLRAKLIKNIGMQPKKSVSVLKVEEKTL